MQSEPLYVPVKFQDIPAEHSSCFMGERESCKCIVDNVDKTRSMFITFNILSFSEFNKTPRGGLMSHVLTDM